MPCIQRPRAERLWTSTSHHLPDSLQLHEGTSVRAALLRILISRFIAPHWWQPELEPEQHMTPSEHPRITP